MAQTYATRKLVYLTKKLSPSDATFTANATTTVTSGRIRFKDPNNKDSTYVEWVSFTGITNNGDGTYTYTGLTRDLSQTAVPATSLSTGKTFGAGSEGTLVAMHDQLPDKQEGSALQSFTSVQLAARTSKVVGELFFDTTQNLIVYWNGSAYVGLSAVGTIASATTTSAGSVELAVASEFLAGTDTGSVGPLSTQPSIIQAAIQGGVQTYAADAGANDTYVITLVPALTAYTTGQQIRFKANTVNTGACTININGLGAKSIKDIFGNDPRDGQILASGIYNLIYDGTNFVLQSDRYDFTEFGDGSDGHVTISGNTTLTRDMYYNNLTVTSPGVLTPDGYKIFVKGTLSGNGTIRRNGNAGAAGSGGATAPGGAGGAALNQGTLNADLGGGAGGTAVAGTTGTAANPSYTTINGAAGGAGGTKYGSKAAGAGGTSVRGALYQTVYSIGYIMSLLNPASALLNTTQYKGPSGSGGGGADFTPNAGSGGGGAGGNGGVIWISAQTINFTGTMESTGGAGGNGGADGGGADGSSGGGGGGGNGGVIYLISHTFTSIGTQTLTAGAKGLAGAGTGGGFQGADGTIGNVGVTIQITI